MLGKRLTFVISAAALAASVAAAPTAFATPAAPPAPPAQVAAAPMHQYGHGQEHFLKHLQALHERLALNPQQEQLWQKALASFQQTHTETGRLRHDERQRIDALLQQPILDLAAIRDARLQGRQRAEQLIKQSEDGWLEFYAALDARQKTIVSDDVRQEMRHMRHRFGWRHEGWDHRPDSGGGQQGQPPGPGTPPPAS